MGESARELGSALFLFWMVFLVRWNGGARGERSVQRETCHYMKNGRYRENAVDIMKNGR
jgi:hypothetical protein